MISLSELQIGLVLAGGGGKGAYQIGCWRALRSLGLTRFKVISGTSVGALNGALIAMGDVGRAEDVWLNLKESQVLEANERHKRRLIRRFKVTMFLKLLLVHVGWAALLAFGVGLLTAFMVLMVEASARPFPDPTLVELLAWDRFLQALIGLPVWALGILAIFALLSVGIIIDGFKEGQLGKKKYKKLIITTARAIGSVDTVGSNKPLLDLMKRNISLERMAVSEARVFATISVWHNFRDPYTPVYIDTFDFPIDDWDHQGQIRMMKMMLKFDVDHVPGLRSKYMSEAVEISSLADDTKVCAALLQSASLPMVFQQGVWEGKAAMDGGLTDNTPIYPAAEHGCDVIIVVYLSDDENPNVHDINASLDKCHKNICQRTMTEAKARELYRGFCHQGLFEDPAFLFPVIDAQLVFVVPQDSLGSTLDFTGNERAKRLMCLGERDMTNAIRRHPVLGHLVA